MLEAHFGRGLLAVADRRDNFARVFDLAERVIPRKHYRRKVGRAEAGRELVRLAARSHGVATAGDLADYYRMPVREARQRIVELVEAGELHRVRVEGWREPAYLHPEASLPRRIDGSALLSPFEPVVWTRERAARLFDFDYSIEISCRGQGGDGDTTFCRFSSAIALWPAWTLRLTEAGATSSRCRRTSNGALSLARSPMPSLPSLGQWRLGSASTQSPSRVGAALPGPSPLPFVSADLRARMQGKSCFNFN